MIILIFSSAEYFRRLEQDFLGLAAGYNRKEYKNSFRDTDIRKTVERDEGLTDKEMEVVSVY